MLETLSFACGHETEDDGVAVLAQGLLAAPRTSLTNLNLEYLGMGKRGMASLANVIRVGHVDRLETLCLSRNDGVGDDGFCALARAVEESGERGVPILSIFGATSILSVTEASMGALASALINKCTRLTHLGLDNGYSEAPLRKAMAAMVRVAGCQHRLLIEEDSSDDEEGDEDSDDEDN